MNQGSLLDFCRHCMSGTMRCAASLLLSATTNSIVGVRPSGCRARCLNLVPRVGHCLIASTSACVICLWPFCLSGTRKVAGVNGCYADDDLVETYANSPQLILKTDGK